MMVRNWPRLVIGFVLLFVATTVVTSAISIQPAQAQMQFHSHSAQNTLAVTMPTHFAAAETDNCGFGWALDWIACPLSGGLLQFITDMIRNVVSDLLYMDTNQLFSPEFKTAWTVFQRIGFAVIIISGLIMVISHSLGMELFDAYTIKKLLPRLVIAIFGMAVAWPMLKFVITFFNDIGLWTHSLIVKPFENIGNNTNIFDLQNPASAAASALDTQGSMAMEWGIVITALLAGAIQAVLLGPLGILSLLTTIALAVLIGVATLIIRQIIIMVTVLFAPLAIACYVLPGTKKIANFWQNTLTTTLMMFPIVMALIGAGEAMSRVAASVAENSVAMKLMSIIVYFAPYFMIPMAFKMAGGLMANVVGIVNDRSKGAFDRLSKFRQGRKAERAQTWKAGSLENSPEWLNNVGRRYSVGYKGRFGFGERGNAALSAAGGVASQEYIKNNPRFAQFGMDDDPGVAIQALAGGTRQGARAALASLVAAGTFGTVDTNASATVQAQQQAEIDQQAEDAFERASAFGFSRQSSQAALTLMAQNKSRAIANGRTDLIREGIERLAAGNDALNDSLVGGFAFHSRGAGRADLGGMNWGLSGQRASFARQVDSLARDMIGAPRVGPLTQVQQAQYATARANAERHVSMLDGIGRTKVHEVVGGHDNGIRQAMETSRAILETSQDQALREQAARNLYSLHQGLAQASESGQKIIVQQLQDYGVNFDNPEDISKQIIDLANAGIFGRPGIAIGQDNLTRSSRTYGGDTPPSQRFNQPPPQNPGSDRRLKRDIQRVDVLGNGIRLYKFRYIWSRETYVGVMAQDLLRTRHEHALQLDAMGYYRVDYGSLGLRMITYSEWLQNACSIYANNFEEHLTEESIVQN